MCGEPKFPHDWTLVLVLVLLLHLLPLLHFLLLIILLQLLLLQCVQDRCLPCWVCLIMWFRRAGQCAAPALIRMSKHFMTN